MKNMHRKKHMKISRNGGTNIHRDKCGSGATGRHPPGTRQKIHHRSKYWGACRPPNPPASLGGPKAPPDPPPGGQGPPDPPCAQARIARTAREHEARLARNMISNHTDMYDNYCADCYDIHPIQSQYTKVAAVGRHHKRGAAALRPRHLFCGFLCLGFE